MIYPLFHPLFKHNTRKTVLAFSIIMSYISGTCQFNALQPPNTYQSADNPYYWKNRMPNHAYWQQDVHYTITASIDEVNDVIVGDEELEYQNNSPDDLTYVFFHLYQEAFQPNSYYDELQKANNRTPVYGPFEQKGWGTEISSLTSFGQELKTEQDNTILKVWLAKPLKSGEKVVFKISFKTYYGPFGGNRSGQYVRRRMKVFDSNGYKHFDGVHWYPRIAVYDRKFGWTTDQHLGHEFYGDFGTYDVSLNFASNYVVGATGNLLNRDEVLPNDLRKKLDVNNFAVPRDSVSVITPYNPKERKIWRYHAENVHDFAFTADPTYRIGETFWKGIRCISLSQEKNSWGWQNASSYTAKIIKTYSEEFGLFAYPKMIVADARDGMEYPMLTLDGGSDPGYRGLLCHEVGHNWFFGMVGSNETYRAALDEGFTNFATDLCLECIEGDTIPSLAPRSKYVANFYKPAQTRERSYGAYLYEALRGTDPKLNTHSDDFSGAIGHGGGYRQVYFKTETMLWNLQYVLGDEMYKGVMQFYFERWKIAHPYWEDFKKAIMDYSGADLNWFFDEWFTTSKTIDYAILSVKKDSTKNGYVVKFKRNKDMQMPIDFTVYTKDGESYNFYIPNTWFEKQTTATILPRWIGWGSKLGTTYNAHINVPGKIRDIVIDTTNRLADINMLNNRLKLPISVTFDSKIYNSPDRTKYVAFASPDIWWNGYDGVKVGMHLNGSYMNYKHVISFQAWLSTGMGQYLPAGNPNDTLGNVDNEFDNLSFIFTYNTPLNKFSKHTNLSIKATNIAGANQYHVGLDKLSDNQKTRFSIFFNSLFRKDSTDLKYLLIPDEWQVNKYNNTINVNLNHTYNYVRGRGSINLLLKSSSIESNYNYAQVIFTALHTVNLGKIKFRTRAFVQYTSGTDIPYESQLFLAGANPEQLLENKFTQAAGFYPYEWMGYGSATNHFHYGGGLNLRGYAGYLAPEEIISGTDTIYRSSYKGNSGTALNVEMNFEKLIPFKLRRLSNTFKLESYLFSDMGIISINTALEQLTMGSLRADAGIGVALTIKRWGPLQTTSPLTIRADFPMFLNRTPYDDPAYISGYRWVIAVKKAF